jgi:lipopolysaccharide biosynthesis glycosyltransferase
MPPTASFRSEQLQGASPPVPPSTVRHLVPATNASCPLIFACDEAYAMPLATTLRSLAESNSGHWPLDVRVLTDGISDASKDKVLGSLPDGALQIRWMAVELEMFRQFEVLEHVSRMTYARLLIPHLLDDGVARVLYLDTDILVLGELAALWQTDLAGAPVGAVADYHIDADFKGELGGQPEGVPRVRDYFNAGVLLIDLQECRRLRISERALDYLRTHAATPYSDQDALNVACDGQWKPLERTWNFQNHHCIRIGRLAPARRPAIVHFITSSKPWKPSSTSVNAGLYDSFRDRTRFRRAPLERMRSAFVSLGYRVRRRLAQANANVKRLAGS